MSITSLIAPLLASADPAALRRVAEKLDGEAALLRARAADLERADKERERRRKRQVERSDALDAMRAARRAGESAVEAAMRLAPSCRIAPDALLQMHLADFRRWSAVERRRRDAEIVRLATVGYRNAEIADLMCLSPRQVGAIVRAGIDARQQLQPVAVRRRAGPLASEGSRDGL